MVSRHQVKKVILPMVDCMGFEVLKLVTNISFFRRYHLPSENPTGTDTGTSATAEGFGNFFFM